MTTKQIQAINKGLSKSPKMFFEGHQVEAFILLHSAVATMFEDSLLQMYQNEFEAIDGRRQHRDGLTFEEWRREKGIE